MFVETPLIASLVIVVPTVVIMGLCLCLCTMTDDGDVGDEPYSSDEEVDDLPPPADDVENVKPDEDDPDAAGEEPDPNIGSASDPAVGAGDGLRKRIVGDPGSDE